MWLSAHFFEDSMSFDRDYFCLLFAIRRQSSPISRRDQHGHLHPLSKTQCLLTETTLVSPSSSRDKQVRWHVETNVVVCSFCRRLNVFRSRLLLSPLHHPETIKSYDMQRPMWPSTYFVKDSMYFDRDYFSLPFVIQRQSSWMTRRDQCGRLLVLSNTQCLSIETTLVSPSSSRDKQVRWYAETDYGHLHPLLSRDN